MNGLRIVFFGTPDFAVATLDALRRAGKNIVTVVTAPDQPAGRGLKMNESAVKQYAVKNNIPAWQPEKLKNPDFLQAVKELNADLFIVVAFRMMPEVLWSMPPSGTFNLHASLLPQYRGAAPINRAVMNGETTTGVTTFFLKHEIDTGSVIFSEKVRIGPDETAGHLHDRLMVTGGELVVKTVNAIEQNSFSLTEQSSLITSAGELKHAPKIFKTDCLISWDSGIHQVYNQVRGLSPYPAAYTLLTDAHGKTLQLKIISCHKEEVSHHLPPSSIQTDERSFLKIAATGGFIFLHEVQLEGKKRMAADEFLRGFKINSYTVKK